MTEWVHDSLANDLASHLVGPDRMIWRDMQLGATPAGLVSKSYVPHHCGLIYRHENAWRLAKRATINPCVIPEEALLINGIEREGPGIRRKHWNSAGDKFSAKFGATAARYVADAASIHRDIEVAQERARQIVERAHADAEAIKKRVAELFPSQWRELVEVLSLPHDTDHWGSQARDWCAQNCPRWRHRPCRTAAYSWTAQTTRREQSPSDGGGCLNPAPTKPRPVFRSECGQYLCRWLGDGGQFEAWTVDGARHWGNDCRIRTWADAERPCHPMDFSVGGYSATKTGQKKGSFTLYLLHCDITKFVEAYRGNTIIENLSIVFRRKIPPQNVPHWIRSTELPR
jgi:hypothetical protein